jgi:hypothetical protein
VSIATHKRGGTDPTDGTISFADWLLASGTTPALAEGVLSDSCPGAPDNHVGYDGYVFNAETELYTVRFRSFWRSDAHQTAIRSRLWIASKSALSNPSGWRRSTYVIRWTTQN